jgi:hypothetical protein
MYSPNNHFCENVEFKVPLMKCPTKIDFNLNFKEKSYPFVRKLTIDTSTEKGDYERNEHNIAVRRIAVLHLCFPKLLEMKIKWDDEKKGDKGGTLVAHQVIYVVPKFYFLRSLKLDGRVNDYFVERGFSKLENLVDVSFIVDNMSIKRKNLYLMKRYLFPFEKLYQLKKAEKIEFVFKDTSASHGRYCVTGIHHLDQVYEMINRPPMRLMKLTITKPIECEWSTCFAYILRIFRSMNVSQLSMCNCKNFVDPLDINIYTKFYTMCTCPSCGETTS